MELLPKSQSINEVDLRETACFCDEEVADNISVNPKIQLAQPQKSFRDFNPGSREFKRSGTFAQLIRRSSHSPTETEKDFHDGSNNTALYKNKGRILAKVHSSNDHRIQQEVKKLIFSSFEPLNFTRLKDNTKTNQELAQPKNVRYQEQLPLALQSFGRGELVETMAMNNAKSQSQIRIAKFKKIKTLSPVNLFKDSDACRPQTEQKVRDKGESTERILSMYNFDFENSTHKPKVLRPRLNSAKNEKELKKQINYQAFYYERMNSEPNHENTTDLNINKARIVLTRRQSAASKRSMFEVINDENIPVSRNWEEKPTSILKKLNSNKKSSMKFDLSRIVLASKIKNSTSGTAICAGISESKPSEYFFRVPKVINNQVSTGQHGSNTALTSVSKGEYQLGLRESSMCNQQTENSTYNQPTDKVSSSLPDVLDPPGVDYPRSAISSRENAIRSDSQRRLSQRFRTQESVLNKIFNFRITTSTNNKQ